MCKKIFFFMSVVLFVFSSCAHNNNSDVIYNSEDSIRMLTEKREGSMLWTRELESVRLIRDISKIENIEKKIKLTPQVVCISSYSEDGIFPILPGFGSLDTSEIKDDLFSFLDDFCNSVIEWKIESTLFEPNMIFTAALFQYDFKLLWKNCFSDDFPGDSEEKENIKLFESYKLGKPFFDENEIQIPVRFYKGIKSSEGFVDILVYVSNVDSYKINQLKIQNFYK